MEQQTQKTEKKLKVAIVGSGIAGTSAAFLAHHSGHEVSLFEKASYFGGHSNTIQIQVEGKTFPIDTGFLVHNSRTYPNLIQFFEHLGVQVEKSEMTFSVDHQADQIAWAGTSLSALFGQRSNLIKPRFYKMVFDILRLHRVAPELERQARSLPQMTLAQILAQHKFSNEILEWYLYPMAAAIWSTPRDKIGDYPAFSFFEFCRNHGLLQILDRPEWRTVQGGSAQYVKSALEKIADKRLNSDVQAVHLGDENTRPRIVVDGLTLEYDIVVMATHPPETLEIVKNIAPDASAVLGAFSYQPNLAVVHTDARALPTQQVLCSAWNYRSGVEQNSLSVTYLINKLQSLPVQSPVMVTLNPGFEIDSNLILKKIQYAHPIFNQHTQVAQNKIAQIQGKGGVYYVGAWQKFGFHEDGLKSSLEIARQMDWKVPWTPVYFEKESLV